MSRKPMTLTQKILAHHALGLDRPWVEAGDILRIRVDWTIASELAWNGMDRTYAMLGRPPLADKNRFFLAVDHTVDPVTLATDPRAQKLTQLSRSFAQESGIRHFYDANQTILHTKFYRDLVRPGDVVLGADSHTSSHGGMGAFAIGLGGADITAAMVLGQSWIEVPEAIAVDYEGRLPFGFGGKDVILKTLGTLKRNTVAMERTVEYRGPAVAEFSTDVRFTIANMTAEFGGLNGVFEPDGVVASWLASRQVGTTGAPVSAAMRATDREYAEGGLFFRADADAPYVARYTIDLTALEPLVAKPFSPDNIVPAAELAGQKLDGVFIGACTTTEEELVLGALVLEAALAQGQKPVATAAGKRLVVPGDLSIQSRLAAAGLWAHYEAAGFRVGVPGCSMCLGVASEKAGPGEHWLSSQNRNYRNRMGEGSLAYLASGATVAASALGLTITDPRPLLARVDPARFDRLLGRATRDKLPDIRHTEPSIAVSKNVATGHATDGTATGAFTGRVQRFGDHVDTDAIIPGQFCHLTTLPELGEKAFALTRPEFAQRAREGANIVVAGEAWGSGSSREQAVWALQGAGVRAVLARSFAFIHKRNLVNEALPYLVVTDDAFYQLASEGVTVTVDLGRSVVAACGREFTAHAASPIVKALQREGGLVPAIQRHGAHVFEQLT
jgi:aconitate hydratase/homoaconitate hydratase